MNAKSIQMVYGLPALQSFQPTNVSSITWNSVYCRKSDPGHTITIATVPMSWSSSGFFHYSFIGTCTVLGPGANFNFFDAPLAMIIFVDSSLGPTYTLTVGLWLQSVCMLLEEREVKSCLEGSVADYPQRIWEQLGAKENMTILCGMAVGYEDIEKAINKIKIARDNWGMMWCFSRTELCSGPDRLWNDSFEFSKAGSYE